MASNGTSYEQILTDTRDGVLTVTMNRPERMNAWTRTMGRELTEAIVAANADPDVIAIVVTGAGRGFCAGADMEAVFQDQIDGSVEEGGRTRDWVELMRESKPIIAAINGAAIGVGLSQVLSMDHLVAAEGAKLSLRFVKVGVVPELASSQLVPMRVGFGKASELMLTGKTILAEEAAAIGLIDRVVPADALLDAAYEMALAMGENPQASLAFTKELLTKNMFAGSISDVQRLELQLLDRAYETPEHKEAVAAFIEKREPDFRTARASADTAD
ncbi:MAG: enoyl-CoA hydratase-related protein [Actinomycetota bacterium]